MLGFVVIIGLPIFFSIKMLSPKIDALIRNGDKVMSVFQTISHKIGEYTGSELLTEENLAKAGSAVASFLPGILNSTTNLLANLAIMLFVVYFMLVNGREMEKWLNKFIPFKQENINRLAPRRARWSPQMPLGFRSFLLSRESLLRSILDFWRA
jgi:predicted PurR-regulated permease PerM